MNHRGCAVCFWFTKVNWLIKVSWSIRRKYACVYLQISTQRCCNWCTSETVYIHTGVCLVGIVPGGTMLCRYFFWCTLHSFSFLLMWVFEVSFNSKGTVRHICEKWSPSFSLRSLSFSSPSFPAVHFSSDFVCVLECVYLSRLCAGVCVCSTGMGQWRWRDMCPLGGWEGFSERGFQMEE